ncbi:MAG TPA: ATP phosphoribosyltransferase [Polyangiaceae bacterium]|nr:ATP phosphoribosyltransferase [Polyangiaceae bacterium]
MSAQGQPRPLVVAVAKGRTVKALAPLLRRAGIDSSPLTSDDRTLVRDSGALRFLLLKPDDVPTYVEHGVADLGVCGRDVIREHEASVLVPLDLKIGRCSMAVAGLANRTALPDVPRVATKYPRTAAEHFAKRGVQAEVIALAGSVELAPLVGLADLIVDLVETGETLRQNGLAVLEEVAPVSTVLCANRAAFKLRHAEIAPLIDSLRAATESGGP